MFARLLIEKKTFFPRDWICCKYAFITSQSCMTIKFQIDLVILASSKNFVDRLHNPFGFFFLFSRDIILTFSELFFDLFIR